MEIPVFDRFTVMSLRDTTDNIKGATILASDVAHTKVLEILNKCKDKTFVFTIDKDTDGDECLKGEIYTSFDEFITYFIEKVKLENNCILLIDTDGNKHYPYQIGLNITDVLDQMVSELEMKLVV